MIFIAAKFRVVAPTCLLRTTSFKIFHQCMKQNLNFNGKFFKASFQFSVTYRMYHLRLDLSTGEPRLRSNRWMQCEARSQLNQGRVWGVYINTRPKRCPPIRQEIARNAPPQVRFFTKNKTKPTYSSKFIRSSSMTSGLFLTWV